MSASLSEVLSQLYAAPIRPETWSTALDAVAGYCGCDGVTLFYARHVVAPGIFVSTGLLEGNHIYLSENWYEHDVVAHRTIGSFASGERTVARHTDMLEPGEFETLPIYRDFYPRAGMGKLVSISLTTPNSRIVSLGLHRALTSADFTDEEIDRAQLLAPHIQAALNLTIELADKQVSASSLMELCQALGKGIVALDRGGVVQIANPLATDLLGHRRVSVAHRFSTGHRPVDAWISRAVAAAEAGKVPAEPMLIPALDDQPAVVVQLIPAPPEARGNYYDLALTVLLTPLRGGVAIDPALLSHVLGLTPAEARLASAVASGKTPTTAAGELGITPATAKLVLHRIYKKTGVTRLPALLDLLVRLERTGQVANRP